MVMCISWMRAVVLESITIASLTNDNALPPAELAAAAQEVGLPTAAYDNPAAAISAIDDETALIIIAGSLYLAGDVLRHHG